MIGKRLRKIIQQLLLIFCVLKKKKTCSAYISKINSNYEKQITLLMITNEEKEGLWHYIAVKKLSTLLRGITSKHHGDFYCLNCLHFLEQKINLNLMKK